MQSTRKMLYVILYLLPITCITADTITVESGPLNDDPASDNDILVHDCKTIKKLTPENLAKEVWYEPGRQLKAKKGQVAVKYNHAYGIPVIGIESFTDEAMMRACYLVRFMFADNEHFRRTARQKQMYLLGWKGGVCCPPQVGNSGLTCSCNSKFPLKGIGAPAHEMAHWFLKAVMPVMTDAGDFTLPEFTNKPKWTEQDVKNDMKYPQCKKAEKEFAKFGLFYKYLWNSQQQDKLYESTKIEECLWNHYFIYSGQQKYLHFPGGGQLKVQSRATMKETNPNLYNLAARIWPCDNVYIPVCKDAAFGFTMGLNQTLKIGKADKNDRTKMVCDDNLDKGEISSVQKISQPTEDLVDEKLNIMNYTQAMLKNKCVDVLRERGWIKKKESADALEEGKVEKALTEDSEYDWYLRKCCHTTAKFPAAKVKDEVKSTWKKVKDTWIRSTSVKDEI